MRRFRKFGAALTLAGLVAIGMTAFSTNVNAWGGQEVSNATICKYLGIAATAVGSLPDSNPFKAAVVNAIQQAQTRYGC